MNSRGISARSSVGAVARGLLVVACGLLVAACGGAQSRFATYMHRGQEYFSAGKFTKASIEFRNAIQIAPKDPTARVMVARTAEKLGRVRDAVGIYQLVIESTPDNVDARVELARLFVYAGAPDRALKIVEPGLAQHPEEPRLLTYRAAARSALKDEAGALADVEHALRLDPDNENALGLRARMYRSGGDVAAATALVSAAVRRRPASTQLHEILADLYLAGGEPARAEEQLKALVRLEPDELPRRFQIAVFYVRTGRVDDAQRALEDTVKSFPRSDPAKLTLIEFLAAQRSPEAARKTLEGFIAHEPGNSNLRLGLGALLQKTATTKQALAVYDEVVRREGTEPNGLIALDRSAAIALRENRLDDARRLAAEVLKKSPRDNDALTVRGEISLAQADPAAAIVDLRAVLKDQPQVVGLQRTLAEAYVANGQPELAEQTLHTAMDLDPADATTRGELAKLLMDTQRPEQAVPILEEAVRRAPTDVPTREQLVRAYLGKADFTAARAAALDLKTLTPESGVGSYMAGLVAQAENRLDDAEREYRQALSLQPKALDALSALARLEVRRGEGAAAIDLVKGAAAGGTADAFLLNLLGELYLTQQDVPAALDTLTHASLLAPNWWVPYRSLAAARSMSKDTAGAIQAYQKGIEAAPAEPELVSELAQIYLGERRIDDAIAVYRAWNRRRPQVQTVANNLAVLLVTYRQDRESLDLARDLTRGFDSSAEPTYLDTFGWVHFKRAEYKDALPILQRAVERDPGSREFLYHLGMTELRMGQTDRARGDLEKAVAAGPAFLGWDDARGALASLKSRSG